MPSQTHLFRQHYRPIGLNGRTPSWLRRVWTWF